MDISSVFNLTSSGILGVISVVTTVIIMLLITVRSIIDVANGMGFLPKSCYKFLYRHEEERLKNLLDELGVLPRKDYYKALTISLDNPHLRTSDMEDIKKCFQNICKPYIEDVGKDNIVVGDKTRLPIRYYLNLRKAFCDGHDMDLSDLMASFIMNEMRTNKIIFDCIVSRKSALDLLGYTLSKMLKLPFILYHDQPSIFYPGTGKIKDFDFIPNDKKKPLIVDDSCVGGNSILEMANSLRSYGFEVNDAFCFYSRSPDSESVLNNNGIKLHYLECYDDKTLASLRK